jgi:hypothetical protein
LRIILTLENGSCSIQGLAKQFHEEVYPLSVFAKHLYGARSDIQCLPNLDNRDFDARIFDYSTAPPSELKIEITSAIDGYTEHLRMKYFVEHCQVNAVGEVSVSGTKQTGHKIHVEDEVFAHTDLLQRICSLIRLAVERKSVQPDTPQKYGPGHIWLCSDAVSFVTGYAGSFSFPVQFLIIPLCSMSPKFLKLLKRGHENASRGSLANPPLASICA